MKKSPLILAALITVAAPITRCAADLYWDTNDSFPGAGDTPDGSWNSILWSTDPLGETAPIGSWVAGETAVFSAGSDAVNAFTISGIGGTSTSPVTFAAGVIVEEGTVILNSGTLGLNAGFVRIDAGAALSTNSSQRILTTPGSVWTLDGGTVISTNSGSAGSLIDADSTITLGAAGGTISYTTSNSLSIVNPTNTISGLGSLTKTGVGVIGIASVCTYLGPTIINEGELRVRGGNDRLPVTTAVIVNSPGIFNLDVRNQKIGSLSGNGDVGTGSQILTIDGPADTTFNGAIKNTANAGGGGTSNTGGSLTKAGAGTITFTGGNDITGTVTLTAGGINVDSTASLCGPTALLVVNGGNLSLNNAAQSVGRFSSTGTGGTVTLGAGHTLTITNAGTAATYSGKISGPGGLVFGGGSETLSGANTYDGTTTVNAGILTVGNATALGSTAGNTMVAVGAEVLFTGAAANFTINEAISIAGPGGTDNAALAVIASANPTISGPITLTADASITVSSSASATFNNAAAITGSNVNLTLRGGNNATGTKLISGVINLGTGGITKIEGGKWSLSAANAYDGTTTISAGTLVAASDSALGTAVGNTDVASAATLGFQGDINYATAEAVSIAGTGVSSAGAISNLSGVNTFAGPITMTANSSIGAVAGSLTLSNAIGESMGPLNLTKVGAGTLTLSGAGANTYAGLTTVSAGELHLNKSASVNALGADATISGGTLKWLESEQLGNASSVTLTTGAADLNGKTETLGTFTNNGGTFSTGPAGHLIGTGASVTWAGGSSTINAGGSVEDGHVVITGGTNIVEGGATGGVLQVNSPGAGLEMTGSTLTLNSDDAIAGKLLLRNSLTTAASSTPANIGSGLALANKGTIDLDAGTRTFTVANGAAASDLHISAGIANGGVIKAGAGALSIDGPQSYSSLRVDEGSVVLGTSLPNATITNEGGLLDLHANANDSTVNANSSGGTYFGSDQTLTALNIGAGGVVILGAAPPAPAAEEPALVMSAEGAPVVPEPGSVSLLMAGALGFLLRRRRKDTQA